MKEMQFYLDTSTINKNGVPIDEKYFSCMRQIRDSLSNRANSYFYGLGVNPRSNLQLKMYILKQYGELALDLFINDEGKYSFAQDKITEVLEEPKLDPDLKKFLEQKRLLVPSVLKKIDTILNRSYQGRIYDLYVHHGTVTGRPTSYRVNILNLPSGEFDPLVYKPEKWNDIPLEEAVPKLISSFRGGIKAGKDKQFVICDLSQIEPRLLAWSIGNKKTLELLCSKEKSFYEELTRQFFPDLTEIDPQLLKFIKPFGMAYLYQAGEKRLESLLIKAVNYLNIEFDQVHFRQCLDILSGMWSGLDYFRSTLYTAFVESKPTSTRYSLVHVDKVLGDLVLLKDNLDLSIVYALRGGSLGSTPLDRYDFVSRVNQKRAGYVHKYLRNKVLSSGERVVLDVYDELVIETSDPESTKIAYKKAFEETKSDLGLDFIEYDVKVSKRYLK